RGLGSALFDEIDSMLAVLLGLVTLAGGGDNLAVGSLAPPAELLGLVLVGFKLQFGRVHLRLDAVHSLLAVRLGLVALSAGGHRLAIAGLEAPAKFLRRILVDLELQLPALLLSLESAEAQP